MALQFIDNSVRISQKLNDVNDAIAGNSTAGGTGQPLYQGLVGKRILLDNAAALQLTNTATLPASNTPAVAQLFAGIYQYVNFLSTMTANPSMGMCAFWVDANAFNNDGTQYQVTCDGSATTGDGKLAGFVVTSNVSATIQTQSVTKGNYAWIQIAGVAWAQLKATPSDNTIGDAAVVVTASNTLDSRADATGTLTWGGAQGIKNFVGIVIDAPGAVAAVSLKRIYIKVQTWLF